MTDKLDIRRVNLLSLVEFRLFCDKDADDDDDDEDALCATEFFLAIVIIEFFLAAVRIEFFLAVVEVVTTEFLFWGIDIP